MTVNRQEYERNAALWTCLQLGSPTFLLLALVADLGVDAGGAIVGTILVIGLMALVVTTGMLALTLSVLARDEGRSFGWIFVALLGPVGLLLLNLMPDLEAREGRGFPIEPTPKQR